MVIELEVVDPMRRDAPAMIDRACRTLGFFRIPLSVVNAAVAEEAWQDALAFFSLSEAEKQQVVFPEPGYPYGYSPFRFETLAASRGEASPADLKESFAVGPDCLGPVPQVEHPGEAWIRSPSRWPARPAGLRSSWSQYFQALSEVSRDLLSLMAVALDLEPDHFEGLIDRHTSAMRALRYPALDLPPTDGALRAGAHTDYGTLTILRTDEVPGLEVRASDGSWSPVAPEPDTLVVNLGDSIARWTNDRWRSTLHRVTVPDCSARVSMAFFHMANWDARIECLPSCSSPRNPVRYPPVLAGPWLMDKFQKTVS